MPCNLPAQFFCDNQAALHTAANPVTARRYFYEDTGQGTIFYATTQVGVHDLHLPT